MIQSSFAMKSWRRLACLAAGLSLLAAPHASAQSAPDSPVANALTFIRGRQNADGSFGSAVQPHLQTALAILALCSVNATLDTNDLSAVEAATAYFDKTAETGGGLGDRVYATESHAAAMLAMLAALDHIHAPGPREAVVRKLVRAVQWLERNQDRGTASQTQGGWKQEGSEGKANDRRATAWALMALSAARQAGLNVKEAGFSRAVPYMLSAFKDKDPGPNQAGGFSVDADGLAVESLSSMGGWVLARLDPEKERRVQNLQWLSRHAPAWVGPNYFYANFFRVRALKIGDGTGQDFAKTLQRLTAQVKDNQQADGSVGFPPGEAQNSIDMGPVFSSAMTVLILASPDSRLFFDETFKAGPRF
jgi:hypothetical protein